VLLLLLARGQQRLPSSDRPHPAFSPPPHTHTQHTPLQAYLRSRLYGQGGADSLQAYNSRVVAQANTLAQVRAEGRGAGTSRAAASARTCVLCCPWTTVGGPSTLNPRALARVAGRAAGQASNSRTLVAAAACGALQQRVCRPPPHSPPPPPSAPLRVTSQATCYNLLLREGWVSAPEASLLRWAANSSSVAPPKHATRQQYKQATALEALVGCGRVFRGVWGLKS
jgi:hypothetical protein